ncbi:tetratricopeptide repeat protein [Photobacterium halotolerans]|uniref:Cytochrome c-552/4 domain-containing protein n=1 Tax=Photobacterium halotolerans TaxID=265726 RepID=A0A0F5VGK0_9GAMM|nr:tetratricopeptide repeat protein [Photobacterium halotolerans]KKD01301.1 hypothetical protein KY46_00200 [Photobacterium halotolerans]
MKQCFVTSALFFLSILMLSFDAVSQNNVDTQCVNCHKKEVQQWKGSHHFHAMAHANTADVLAEFDGITFQKDETVFQLRQREKEYLIDIIEPSGQRTEYKVAYTFGYYPLQQYAFSAGNGKLQFLPFAWDSREQSQGGQRWFDLHPDQQANDPFHWTQMGQNWNQMCADCHTTNFEKRYDQHTKTYQSTYSAVNVSCQACHGEPQQHLAWAAGNTDISNKGFAQNIGKKTPLFYQQADRKMQPAAPLQASQQIEVCASCHARRTQLADRTGPMDFSQHFQGALLTPELYHVDGQVWDENYVWGSFLQSKMYQAGVTCTNCHNPHSGELVLPANQTCTQCHNAETYDKTEHHQHAANSAGSQCVDCHMPATTYMQIDPRRDHSFRVPRPDLSVKTVAPNACNACHQDKSATWAKQQVERWYPASSHRNLDHFSLAFQAADQGVPSASEQLTRIAQDNQLPDIVRASAIERMENYPDRNSLVAIVRAIRDDEPLKRQATIAATAQYPLADRFRILSPLLTDQHMPIRANAARALAPMLTLPHAAQLSADQKTQLEQALDSYRQMQLYNADRGFAHTNLGNLALAMGDSQAAEQYFKTAIDVEPIYAPAYVNLAEVYRRAGNEPQVRAVLEQALAVQPEEASVHYALAMSWVRSGSKDKALLSLKQAVDNAQEEINYLYTYGLLLQDQGQYQVASTYLHRALTQSPANPDVHYTLVQNYLMLKDYDNALYFAQQLSQLLPGNPQIQQLVQQIGVMKRTQF